MWSLPHDTWALLVLTLLLQDPILLPLPLQRRLRGTYECFDRIVTRVLIPSLQYPTGCRDFINGHFGLLDTPQHLKAWTREIHAHIERYAEEHGLPIEFVQRPKERDLLGEANRLIDLAQPPCEGPIAIYKTLRRCLAWNTSQGEFALKLRRVYHYEIYVWDEECGLCRFTLSTYLPLNVEGYVNQHNWLREQLRHRGVLRLHTYLNSFQELPLPPEEFQVLCDQFDMDTLDRLHRKWLDRLLPMVAGQHRVYLRQTEVCSNLLLDDPTLTSRHLTRSVLTNYDMGRPERVAFFFHRHRKPRGETRVGRIDGQASVKVQHGNLQGKVYQKRGAIRLETTVNDTYDLGVKKRDLEGVRQKARAINRRLATVLNDPRVNPAWIAGQLESPFVSRMHRKQRIAKISFWDDQAYQAMHALARVSPGRGAKTEELTEAVNQGLHREGDHALNPRQVHYIVLKLREHGLAEKVEGTRLYRLTDAGEAFLRLWVVVREEIVEPFLPVVREAAQARTEGRPRKAPRGRPRAGETLERARAGVEESLRTLLKAVGVVSTPTPAT